MRDLESIRTDIDAIDKAMLALFEERMHCSEEVALYKKEQGISILCPDREEALLASRLALTKEPAYQNYVDRFFRMLMSLSRDRQLEIINESRYQEPIIHGDDICVAYQGVPGANSEQATNLYFGEEAKTIACEQFIDVFKKVKEGNADYGVVPIENSTAGSVHDVYDLLGFMNCYIVGEQMLEINHCLLAKKGTKTIRKVYSHPQALRQCQLFLKANHLEGIAFSNTAAAAKFVAESDADDIAAIASLSALKHYDLEVVQEGIQDVHGNMTRFVVVSNDPKDFTGLGKISLCLTIKHESGSLFRVLQYFANQNLNLVKIESRAIPSRPFEYLFYMDFEGDIGEEAVERILHEIAPNTLTVQMLGAYFSDNTWRK